MRLTRIAFEGYKRLLSTSCNVDGKLIAILGPNEAGKSSVLEALDWLSNGEGRIAGHIVNRRSKPADTEGLVQVTFVLEEDDCEALAEKLPDCDFPTTCTLSRAASGTRYMGLQPQIKRSASSLTIQVHKEIQNLDEVARLAILKVDHPSGKTLDQILSATYVWTEEDSNYVKEIADTFNPFSFGSAAELVDNLRLLAEREKGRDINAIGRNLLFRRYPKFVLFGPGDRLLRTDYELGPLRDPSNEPPRCLSNIMALAELKPYELAVAVENKDTTRVATLLKRANKRLQEQIMPTWQQSQLALHLDINGSALQVLVDELHDDGTRTAIEERSDGLRSFLALVSFLASKRDMHGGHPVTLLIDEIEQHLHYDAQADLLAVLQAQTEAAKVIYTTHSPGCLPSDLGTSVRFVEPHPEYPDASRLRNDFWQTSHIGFSPLLFAMGAGAAAFSACRRAVLAEGATEMILLPTLIRVATGLTDLPYQVAPGLSSLREDGIGMDEVAARVAYLVDGDAGGKRIRKRLLGLGVPTERISSLPQSQTIEDLLDRPSYIAAVTQLLKDRYGEVEEIAESDLSKGLTITKALGEVCAQRQLAMPGKTAVASYLAQNPSRVGLTINGAAVLNRLHNDFCRAIESPSFAAGDVRIIE